MRLERPPAVPQELLDHLVECFPYSPKQLGGWVRSLSDSYVREHSPSTAALSAGYRLAAYARYYLPANYGKLWMPLSELERDAVHSIRNRNELRVLDLGTGPGTFLLAVLGFAHQLDTPLERIFLAGIDLDRKALELARELCSRQAKTLFPDARTEIQMEAQDILAQLPAELSSREFDFIFAGNVLAERAAQANPEEILSRLQTHLGSISGLLRKGGALVLLEPALKDTSRLLLALRDRLVRQSGLFLYSPCLHSLPCPALERERDWCHERLPWEKPKEVQRIDQEAGLDKDALAFSYLVFRTIRGNLIESYPAGQGTLGRVVSDGLPEKGKHGCIACTAQGRRVYYEALDRKPGNAIKTLREFRRGDVGRFPDGRSAGQRQRLDEDSLPSRED